jgi:hypothetical protein
VSKSGLSEIRGGSVTTADEYRLLHQNKRLERVKKRLEKTRIFLNYLREQELSELAALGASGASEFVPAAPDAFNHERETVLQSASRSVRKKQRILQIDRPVHRHCISRLSIPTTARQRTRHGRPPQTLRAARLVLARIPCAWRYSIGAVRVLRRFVADGHLNGCSEDARGRPASHTSNDDNGSLASVR